MIEMTTIHYGEWKRNKQHKFLFTEKYDEQVYVPTGKTRCGRFTYTPLREPKPTDTKCKLCYR